jgi:ATP-binding cassette subfamily B (MDR/TAP) protein 1
VVDKGKVAELGTHGDLVNRNGIYAGMVAKQQLQSRSADEKEGCIDDMEMETMQVSKEGNMIQADEKIAVEELLNIGQETKIASESIMSLIAFVTSLNRPEWWYILSGLIFSTLAGGLITLYFSRPVFLDAGQY